MGSYCSVHNDTRDETVLVYVGANPHVIKPILWTLSGFATMLSGAAAWGIISATVVELSLASYSVVITASTIASATGSFVSATNWALESLQNKFVWTSPRPDTQSFYQVKPTLPDASRLGSICGLG